MNWRVIFIISKYVANIEDFREKIKKFRFTPSRRFYLEVKLKEALSYGGQAEEAFASPAPAKPWPSRVEGLVPLP